ncbi:hypothetical protein B566_EDAN007306 [Ephemera danica]|nr:hypothetical protein B566_EDAN007306 [Ephemera danica]
MFTPIRPKKMPVEGSNLLTCYNRGCGQQFNPEENKEDACTFHPGAPYFHDAYKGWSCCKRKCTDFTEFLNMKGCTKSYHNPEKPPEPVKPITDKLKSDEVIIVRPPEPTKLKRPSFDTPQVTMKCEVSLGLTNQAAALTLNPTEPTPASKEIALGTPCKNNTCKQMYNGPESNNEMCVHHPGQPVFHEGAKFWSCCMKRTFDFDVFLNQKGCEDPSLHKQAMCRYDWHQTASSVVVAIYAKKYSPSFSWVQLSPVRLTLELFFPEQNNYFNMDIELYGLVDEYRSKVNMMSTKVEVHLHKREPGSWQRLEIPHPSSIDTKAIAAASEPESSEVAEKGDEPVDLSDL